MVLILYTRNKYVYIYYMAYGSTTINIGKYWIPSIAKEYASSESFGGNYNYFYNASELYNNGRGTASKIGNGTTNAWDNFFVADKYDISRIKTALSGIANMSYSFGKSINFDKLAAAVSYDSGIKHYNMVNYINKENTNTSGKAKAGRSYEELYGKRLEKLVQVDVYVGALYDDTEKKGYLTIENYDYKPAFPHPLLYNSNPWNTINMTTWGNGYMAGE